MPIYKTGRIKDGKAQYRVFVNKTDANGKVKRSTKCVYGLAEAKRLESEMSNDVLTTAENITLQQLYDEYIKVKECEVRQSSLQKTKSILSNHILNTELQHMKLAKINKKVITKWKTELWQKDLKTSTKNNAIKELNTLLNYGVKIGYIHVNPLKGIGKFKDAYFEMDQEKMQYYTSEQFQRFIAVARGHRENFIGDACYIFFLLAFYTGMRKGELNALKWSDIDEDIIHVRRSICQKVKGYEETPPKNKASYRSLKIPQKILTELKQYRAELIKAYGDIDFRVCGGLKPIADSTLEKRNKQYSEEAGLHHIRIHDFRHSHASLLINSGINIMAISRRLGHSDVKMTWNTYGHLYPQTEDSAINVLNTA